MNLNFVYQIHILTLQIAWFFQDVTSILLIMLPWMFRSPVNLCRLLVVGIILYPVVSCEFSKILKYVDSVKQYVHILFVEGITQFENNYVINGCRFLL